MNHLDGCPVSGGPAPAVRGGHLGGLVDVHSAQQQRILKTFMSFVWRYKADSAVAVFLVVPVHELAHP